MQRRAATWWSVVCLFVVFSGAVYRLTAGMDGAPASGDLPLALLPGGQELGAAGPQSVSYRLPRTVVLAVGRPLFTSLFLNATGGLNTALDGHRTKGWRRGALNLFLLDSTRAALNLEAGALPSVLLGAYAESATPAAGSSYTVRDGDKFVWNGSSNGDVWTELRVTDLEWKVE